MQAVKPAEKIDSIRIHHVGGNLGANSGGDGGASAKPPVNQAIDSIMEMALQLPALNKIGEELGLNVESSLKNISAPKDEGKPDSK